MNQSQGKQSPDSDDRPADVERLVELATILEAQLSGETNGKDLLSSLELTHEQVDELQRARRALGFLRQAQEDIKLNQAMCSGADEDSNTLAYDSTQYDFDASTPDDSPAVDPSDQIGRFRLRKVLGQGGFCLLYTSDAADE